MMGGITARLGDRNVEGDTSRNPRNVSAPQKYKVFTRPVTIEAAKKLFKRHPRQHLQVYWALSEHEAMTARDVEQLVDGNSRKYHTSIQRSKIVMLLRNWSLARDENGELYVERRKVQVLSIDGTMHEVWAYKRNRVEDGY